MKMKRNALGVLIVGLATILLLTAQQVGKHFTVLEGGDATGQIVTPVFTEAASGTHVLFSTLRLHAATVNPGAASVTNTATLYILDAGTVGTSDYALWVDAGEVRGDGGFTTGLLSAANNVTIAASTSPIVFEGATDDAFETTVAVVDATADSTFTLPDQSLTAGTIQVSVNLAAAALQVDTIFFVANRIYEVTAIRAIWDVAETAAGDFGVEKLTGTTECGSGDELQGAVVDGTATPNTVVTPALTSTGADLIFAVGDSLCLDFSSANGELAGLAVTVEMVPSR